MSAAGECHVSASEVEKSAEPPVPFRDDCTKPLERLFSFLKKNSLPDDLATSVLYQVHEDLVLVRKWTNLRVVNGATRPYLAGSAAVAFDSVFPVRKGSNDDGVDRTQVIMPISVQEKLSPFKLKELCRACIHPETGKKLRCVTVAIVDDDSTTAYYRIFDSFAEIVHPQWKQKKKRSKNDDVANGAEERIGDANMQANSESESDESNYD